MTPERIAEIRQDAEYRSTYPHDYSGDVMLECLDEIERLESLIHMVYRLNTECMRCIGYATTVRRENTELWLNGFVDRLNAVLVADGDRQFAMRRGDGLTLIDTELSE